MNRVYAADRAKLMESLWHNKLAAHLPADVSPTAFLLADQTVQTSVFGKYYDAFPADSVGDFKPVTTQNVLILTPDTVADDISTTQSIAVDGPHIVSTINTIGDQDFFRVELVAGRTYDIGQYLVTAGPSGVPLSDAYIEIYDSAGNLLTSADGGGPNTEGGLDALLTFIPDVSGTYYINARAFDQDSVNGTTGDSVGDYQLFVDDVTDNPTYVPYYDIDSPLHAIDWGSQVDRTSRNPDGEEGPRITDNAYSGTGWNPYGIEGKNVITVYFAKAGDIYVSEDPANPGLTTTMVAQGVLPWERDAFLLALDQFEQVADLVFVVVENRAEADFHIITYEGTPGVGPSVLGRMSPPNEDNEGQMEINSGDVRWTEEGVTQGGFYFPTLIHEFAHGLGMAHPHDNGGRSSIMRGAGTPPVTEGGLLGGGTGDFDLSQQVHTIMSYNDGWTTSPYGQPRSSGTTGTDHFGWVGTLSPLDIAVIQDKYGVNEDWATGDDTYTLKDVNAPGTFYSSIWDAAGIDQIVYAGARDASIDLRAATLQYEEGGGGRVSYAYGIHGGFTIANGVTIENARTGSGNDNLHGNGAANLLDGGAGNDTLNGDAGNDTLIGGGGQDSLTGGAGADRFQFASLGDSVTGPLRDLITDFEQGSDLIDFSALTADRFIGSAAFSGRTGEVRYAAFDGGTIIEVDANGDRIADLQVQLDDFVALTIGDFAGVETDASGRGGGGKKNSILSASETADSGAADGGSGGGKNFAFMAPTDQLVHADNYLLI